MGNLGFLMSAEEAVVTHPESYHQSISFYIYTNTALYLIRVTVGTRPPVLQVSFPVLGTLSWYPDTAASIGHASTEVVDTGGLIGTREPSLIVLPFVGIVSLDVADMVAG